MSKTFKFFTMALVCTVSAVSFCFLNSLAVQQKDNSFSASYTEKQSEQSAGMDTENKFDSLDINKFNSGNKDNKEKSLLPSVEIFKYLAQKGVEMLPVMRLRDFIPLFN